MNETALTERHQQYVRSQKDRIRIVMESAAESGVWLTLAELSHLVHSGEASVSAELRNLRKDGFLVFKQIRTNQTYEYRLRLAR